MRRGRLLVLLLGGLVLLVLVAAIGVAERRTTVSALARTADTQSVEAVTVVGPTRGPRFRELTLPGDVHAWYEAPIFGQVTGYVQAWYKDYGATVRRGDLLGMIDTPSLDQQVAEARAELAVREANYQLAQVTADRWKRLEGTQAVSQQDVDVRIASARAEKAQVDAARSAIARLAATESFKRLVAPFDGVVTARNTDIGDYVNAAGGNAGSNGSRQALFTVSEVDRLRVFVSVPQDYSAFLKPGVTATLGLPQFPGRLFSATFLTTSRSVDAQSRTVLTELEVDNRNGELLPGAFAEVHFRLPTDPSILIVPEQSLLFRDRSLQVALVRNDRIHLQDVTPGLNLGASVQVVSGLRPEDRIVANPSLGLLEGETVRVVRAPSDGRGDGATEAARQAGHPA